MNDYRVSNRRACKVLFLHRSSWFYKGKSRNNSVLRKRIRDIAQTRVRYGSRRIATLLRREGWRDNHKRIHRLYCLKGLNLRSKRPRRKRAATRRLDRPKLYSIDQCWSMDFVADQLFDGRKIRALIVVDNYIHQCVAIHVGQSLKGTDVVAVMNYLKIVHFAVPERIQADAARWIMVANLSAAADRSKALDLWAYDNRVTLNFSRPSKPTARRPLILRLSSHSMAVSGRTPRGRVFERALVFVIRRCSGKD